MAANKGTETMRIFESAASGVVALVSQVLAVAMVLI